MLAKTKCIFESLSYLITAS